MYRAKASIIIVLPFYFYMQRDDSIMNRSLNINNKVESLMFISQYLSDLDLKMNPNYGFWKKRIQMQNYSTLYKQSTCEYFGIE